ncbi:Bikaverin cluster transcription factor bik5 [Penicillium rolfsii]|nr:Bikaverin cluster transcription factor bik5 [Penicillium rolfsii]
MATVSVSNATVAGASASKTEKNASSPTAKDAPSASTSGAGRTPKPRSCVVCRTRKVRCDKQSPCSNCRRANIACIVPSKDRPPRWARRLVPPAPEDVMERLRTLENLVRDLRGQLEEATARASSARASSAGVSPAAQSPESSTHDPTSASSSRSDHVQKRFGRLVLQDTNQSRYIGSGFWSRVTDELDELKMATEGLAHDEVDTSDEEDWSSGKTPSTQELERSPEDRNAFMFRHNLMNFAADLRDFHPLPSQIPFLLGVFSENVNMFLQSIHEPTITKMIRDLRGDMTGLTPANEALMFSIYYAAVTSMEEEDVMINFGSTKAELNLKYRLGLEHALAKADFLNVPDLVLIQALVNFLALARRHDSPRFVWMMVGIAIRMAISLGLHRDGTNFQTLSPFEIEMRRRIWWSLCLFDVRASEDQGTEFTIAVDSFDTKIPLNINNSDIQPDSKQMPPEREGLTDMSISRVSIKTCEISKRMMIHGPKAPSLEEQEHMIQQIYQELDEGFLRYSTESNIAYWVIVIVARLMVAKMTLFIYLPVLFSSPSEQLTEQLRTKLLLAAIEVAEYNHALNAEQACRQWRWIFQTYTHWHAIIYILIEICRRPWSPLVERAWTALHSVWLIPTQSNMRKNLRMWFPLKKLMNKGNKHREDEVIRLRNDTSAAEKLQKEYLTMVHPSSNGHFPAGSNAAALFLGQWKQMIQYPTGGVPFGAQLNASSIEKQSPTASSEAPPRWLPGTDVNFKSMSASNAQLWQDGVEAAQNPEGALSTPLDLQLNAEKCEAGPHQSPIQPLFQQDTTSLPQKMSSYQPPGDAVVSSLWNDDFLEHLDLGEFDNDMELNSDIDWYDWVESAKGME